MIKQHKIIAIIPARGGSKGIPKKNIIDLNGNPLISYSINAAKNSKYIERVIVSTDDDEISNTAMKYGAEVITRPIDISGDKSASELSIIHVINKLNLSENYFPEFILFLQCTSPLTLTADIDGLIEKFILEKADSGLSVSRFYHFLWKIENDNLIGINHEKSFRPMRQERENQYLENGAMYIFKAKEFMNFKYRFFGKTIFYEMPQNRNLEIDEPFDLFLAKNMMKNIENKSNYDKLPNKIDLLIMDFDGVFTDNLVYVCEDGRETVKCSRGDGMGLGLLKKANLSLLVISTEKNLVVNERCKKLGIEVIQDVSNKLPLLIRILEERNISKDNVIYIGNDINDLECIQYVNCGVCVNDAVDEIKNVSKIVLNSNGGNGALRELSNMILEKIK